MKHLLILLSLFALVFGAVGCSDNDPPTGGGNGTVTGTTNLTEDGYYSTNLDATGDEAFTYYSFTTKDTVASAGIAKPLATVWDLAFRREEIKTNGGVSTSNEGDLEAASLGVVPFADVVIADTAGVSWTSDFIDYFIDDWYDYNPVTHSLAANSNVYSMVDASGDHYVKFQIDSMVGAAQPPDMGTVYIKYFYQTSAGSSDLSGTVVEATIPVGAVKTYFDFSSGSVVIPATPEDDAGWDIAFYAYELSQNSGPNGTGACAAFLAYTELTNPDDIDAFTTQPAEAPMFPDIAGTALTEWYNYTGPPLHQLPSKSEVYLLKTGDMVYKMRIESYYGEAGDKISGNYNFIWEEL